MNIKEDDKKKKDCVWTGRNGVSITHSSTESYMQTEIRGDGEERVREMIAQNKESVHFASIKFSMANGPLVVVLCVCVCVYACASPGI